MLFLAKFLRVTEEQNLKLLSNRYMDHALFIKSGKKVAEKKVQRSILGQGSGQMFNRSLLTLPAATYSSLHHYFSRVRNMHKAENKRERSVCPVRLRHKTVFRLIMAMSIWNWVASMDSVCVFPFPCESKGHESVFIGHRLPSSAQESNCMNLCLSLALKEKRQKWTAIRP